MRWDQVTNLKYAQMSYVALPILLNIKYTCIIHSKTTCYLSLTAESTEHNGSILIYSAIKQLYSERGALLVIIDGSLLKEMALSGVN